MEVIPPKSTYKKKTQPKKPPLTGQQNAFTLSKIRHTEATKWSIFNNVPETSLKMAPRSSKRSSTLLIFVV